MRPLHLVFLGAFLLLAPPALGGVSGLLAVDDAGLRLDVRSDAGHQEARVAWSCVPDADGRCTTSVDCAPGTLDCHAFREPDPPWPCTYQPDGSLWCDPNGTQGNQSPDPAPAPQPDPPQPPAPGLVAARAREGVDEVACDRPLVPGACALVPLDAPLPALLDVLSASPLL